VNSLVYWIQFAFALPLATIAMGVFIWALLNPSSIGLFGLAMFMFGLQFCIGPIVALFKPATTASWDPSDIAMAWLAVYTFWIGILITASLWRGQLDPVAVHRKSGEVTWARGIFATMYDSTLRTSSINALFFYAIVAGIRIFMLLVYKVGLSGRNTDDLILSLPYYVLAIHKTFYALGLAFVFLAMVKILNRAPAWPFYILVLGLETAYAFTQGRRHLIGVAVMLMFAFLMKHGRLKPRHAVLAALGFLVLWQFIFPFFVAIRQEWQRNYHAPVSTWVREAWQETITGGEYGATRQRYMQSIHKRLEAMTFNYTVAHQINAGRRPMGGELLRNTFLTLIPRIIFPSKNRMLGGDDEAVAVAMGLPIADFFSNLPAFALADLGPLGGLVYGFMYAFVIRMAGVMIRCLLRRKSVGAFAVFSVVASNMVLQMEFPPASFAFDTRLICSVFLGFYFWTAVFGSSREAEPEYPYPLTEASPYAYPSRP
jgi:hypothetical protein